MTNVFEDEYGSFLALCNEKGQYSLWPASIDVPGGWRTALGPDSRSACLTYIEQNWSAAPAPSTAR
jgi:MbtH protein